MPKMCEHFSYNSMIGGFLDMKENMSFMEQI